MTDTTAIGVWREGVAGLGIKAKLFLAFAGVAGLTLIGSAVALMSYEKDIGSKFLGGNRDFSILSAA
jgi:hypothetical protein